MGDPSTPYYDNTRCQGKIHPAVLLSTGTHRRDDPEEERQTRSSLLLCWSRYKRIGKKIFPNKTNHAWATTSHHKSHTHTWAILCGSSNRREHDDEGSTRETKHVDVSLDDREYDSNESNIVPVLAERRIFAAIVVVVTSHPPPPHSTSSSSELTAESLGRRCCSSTLNAPTSILPLPGVDGTTGT